MITQRWQAGDMLRCVCALILAVLQLAGETGCRWSVVVSSGSVKTWPTRKLEHAGKFERGSETVLLRKPVRAKRPVCV